MADTTITASTPAEAPAAQLWQKELCRQAQDETWWTRFTGEGINNIIQLKKDFVKEKGDAINFGLLTDLSQVIHNDGWVEGNEEGLTEYYDSVVLDQMRNGVRIGGKLSEQRASYEMRKEAGTSLSIWAAEQLDTLIFKKLSGETYQAYPGTASGTLGSLETAFGAAVANSNIIFGGDATATTDIEESDILTLDKIIDAKTCAQTGVFGSSTKYRIRPIRYQGANHYILVIHPYQKADIKKSADYKSMMKEAEVRGKENPLFSGADYYYDGVWIYAHRLCQTASNWGAGGNVAGATGLFLGAQSGLMAIAQEGWDWQEQFFDYGNKWGVATQRIFGFDKAMFNSIDFAVVAIKTAAKNPQL